MEAHEAAGLTYCRKFAAEHGYTLIDSGGIGSGATATVFSVRPVIPAASSPYTCWVLKLVLPHKNIYRPPFMADRISHMGMIQRELLLQKVFNHPNVMPLLASGVDWDTAAACSILPGGMPLNDVIYKFRESMVRKLIMQKKTLSAVSDAVIKPSTALPFPLATGILLKLTRGLKHVHDHSVVHKDLKSANVVLVALKDGRVEPMIIDFSLALVCAPGPVVHASAVFCSQTPYARAPEVYLGRATCKDFRDPDYERDPDVTVPIPAANDVITPAMDVWSLGCIYFNMLFGFFATFPGRHCTAREALKIMAEHIPPNVSAVDAEGVYGALGSTLLVQLLHGPPEGIWSTRLMCLEEKFRAVALDIFTSIFEWDPTKRITVAVLCEKLEALPDDICTRELLHSQFIRD